MSNIGIVALPARRGSIEYDDDTVEQVYAVLLSAGAGNGVTVDSAQDTATKSRVRARKMRDAVLDLIDSLGGVTEGDNALKVAISNLERDALEGEDAGENGKVNVPVLYLKGKVEDFPVLPETDDTDADADADADDPDADPDAAE